MYFALLKPCAIQSPKTATDRTVSYSCLQCNLWCFLCDWGIWLEDSDPRLLGREAVWSGSRETDAAGEPPAISAILMNREQE